jgi:hypothetical protein
MKERTVTPAPEPVIFEDDKNEFPFGVIMLIAAFAIGFAIGYFLK